MKSSFDFGSKLSIVFTPGSTSSTPKASFAISRSSSSCFLCFSASVISRDASCSAILANSSAFFCLLLFCNLLCERLLFLGLGFRHAGRFLLNRIIVPVVHQSVFVLILSTPPVRKTATDGCRSFRLLGFIILVVPRIHGHVSPRSVWCVTIDFWCCCFQYLRY